MIKKGLIVLCCVFWQLSINGQDTLTLSDFLAGAQDAIALQYIQQKIDLQEATDNGLQWIDELEFRTETDEFELRRQEYALRARPNTPRQIKAQDAWNNANIQRDVLERSLAFKDALEQRYLWFVELLELEADIQAKESLKAIYTDKLKVLKRSTGDLDFDIKDLIDAEEDLQDIELDIFKLQQEIQRLKNEWPKSTAAIQNFQYNSADLVNNEQIINSINVVALNDSNSITLAARQGRIDLISKESEIEESERRNLIEFAQVKVGGGNNQGFREYVSFGLGIRVPYVGNDKLKVNELALEKLEEENDLLALKTSLEKEQKTLVERIQLYIEEQELLKSQLENSQAKYAYEQLLKLEEARPMDMLDLKEILVKRKITIQKINIRILERYVKWLSVSGKMMEAPLQNHLLAKREPLPIR